MNNDVAFAHAIMLTAAMISAGNLKGPSTPEQARALLVEVIKDNLLAVKEAAKVL